MRLGSNRLKTINPAHKTWKWVIGIDPGTHTGYAVYSICIRDFVEIKTLTFWEAYDQVLVHPPEVTKVIVEVPETNTVWQRTPKTGIKPIQRQAVNVGRVVREAELLAEGITRAGYFTIKSKPVGKATKARFQRITGYTKRLNQHERDAGLLCWGGRPTSF